VRRSAPAIALIVAVMAVAAAHGAGQRDALVRPGVGIGKIRLGMTPAQVFRALGRTPLVSVGFTGSGNRLRVSKVATTLRRERTAGGIGIGSTVRAILRAYPHAACVGRWYSDPDPGSWVYIGRQPRITAFNIDYVGPGSRGRVAEVVVQRNWITRSRGRGCDPNWRTQ
jgi:hypothetical protein